VDVIEGVFDMSFQDCDHPKTEIPDPLGDDGDKVLVDAAVAPLVIAMADEGPTLACGEEAHDPDESEALFDFADRSDAASFIAVLGDFGRWGSFQVSYRRDHINIMFPLGWVDGLAERYRRNRARRLEQSRQAASQKRRKRRAPHPTVMLDGIKIDAELAPLIKKLWDAGIKTTMCCQEREPGIAWIQFLSRDDALKFLTPATALVSECHWSLVDRHEIGDDFEANPLGCVSVEFPREDLGSLTRLWAPVAGA
jgi:hypothetical protein